MPQATDSQIAMWRGAIALAWIDRRMEDQERQRLLQYFKDNIVLSDSQRALLTKDIDEQTELKDVWGSITDTRDRAHLIDIAPSLFAAHGGPTPADKAVYDKMVADQMATIDMTALEGDLQVVKAQIPLEQAQDEDAIRSEYHHWGPLDRLVYHLDKILQ